MQHYFNPAKGTPLHQQPQNYSVVTEPCLLPGRWSLRIQHLLHPPSHPYVAVLPQTFLYIARGLSGLVTAYQDSDGAKKPSPSEALGPADSLNPILQVSGFSLCTNDNQ